MKALVSYFAKRSFVANIVLIGAIAAAIAAWDIVGKEERPEFSLNWVRVNILYPGASAEDIELFVIKPIEEQLKGVSGLYEITSNASFSTAYFSITTDPNIDNFPEKYQEIKDAVERAELPTETEDPTYDRWNSYEKAIVDVALYIDDVKILSTKDRIKLQELALSLKNKLLSLKEVSGVEDNGYLKPELQIKTDPKKLLNYELPLSEVATQIQRQHIRTPLGVMRDKDESEIAIKSFLDDTNSLENSIVRSSFQGSTLYLKDVAKIEKGFERTTTIRKIQGHEAVVFNVQKSRGVGILKAREAIMKATEKFGTNHKRTGLKVLLLDDESYDIRNRLSIIATNGLLGFLIILVILFLFLDLKSGFWVAMGLPFSLAVTLILCTVVGYSVNNITLAAIIIVLGIVVDDAIIVADSIAKRNLKDKNPLKAATEGTLEVIQPILAGILTTCVAFVPLLFFQGRFGMFVKYIPLVVILMLFASLIESFFILPAHLKLKPVSKHLSQKNSWIKKYRDKALTFLEKHYSNVLKTILHQRLITLIVMVLFLGISAWIFTNELKFVMFPREQSKEFAIKVIAKEETNRLDMAKKTEKIENLLLEDKFKSLVGFRTVIGESRRGGQVKYNEANLRVELLPPSEQKTPMKKMIEYWQNQANQFDEFKEVRFLESWWSSDSGSPIAIQILENNDEKRKSISEKLKSELENINGLKNVEIERPIVKTEYALNLDNRETIRLNLDPAQLANTMRAFIEGQILYRLYEEEEIDVRLTSFDKTKDELEKILNLTTTNTEGYLVPLKQVVTVEKRTKPANIQRVNYKRSNQVYADLDSDSKLTPLEIADYLENKVFPKLNELSPSTIFNFRGEIEDSKESQSDFLVSIIMTLALIFIILTFMFASFLTPIIISLAIPFGMAGVALAFWMHGFEQYGFFAVIGTIGMLGVVINDSIVMLNYFESHFNTHFENHVKTEVRNFLKDKSSLLETVNKLSVTRLRPVLLTTLTTVAGVFPTAYGLGGFDAMLADMMLAMGWGLLFGTAITLLFMPVAYSLLLEGKLKVGGKSYD